MKGLDGIFIILFVVTAGLQFNDPDPVYWVAVYGLGALVPLFHVFGRRARFLAAMTVGMILSGMIYATSGFFDYLQSGEFASITGSMDGAVGYVEPAREFLGLLIALSIVSFYAMRWRGN